MPLDQINVADGMNVLLYPSDHFSATYMYVVFFWPRLSVVILPPIHYATTMVTPVVRST